jgi:hypothetical protein
MVSKIEIRDKTNERKGTAVLARVAHSVALSGVRRSERRSLHLAGRSARRSFFASHRTQIFPFPNSGFSPDSAVFVRWPERRSRHGRLPFRGERCGYVRPSDDCDLVAQGDDPHPGLRAPLKPERQEGEQKEGSSCQKARKGVSAGSVIPDSVKSGATSTRPSVARARDRHSLPSALRPNKPHCTLARSTQHGLDDLRPLRVQRTCLARPISPYTGNIESDGR